MIYVNKKAMNEEYAAGTKVFVYPSKEDSNRLYTFVHQTLGITAKKIVRPDQYHCTVIYSDASCPGAEEADIKLPLVGGVCDWEVFNSPQFGSCLVAVLNSNDIRALNKQIRDAYGATMRFPTFIPHITVAWGYEGEVPTQLPRFSLLFDAYKVAGIDPNWSPAQL
jgi:2'-5' RNA ligase